MNPLSRRRLLKLGGVATAALGGLSFLLMRGGGDAHYRAVAGPDAAPTVLSLKELAVLTALCDRVCPGAADGQPDARTLRIAQRIDRELQFHPKKLQEDVAAALLVVEHGALLHGQRARFTRLDPAAQDEVLTRLMTSAFDTERQVFGSLRLLAMFFYYCDERTWPGMHYEGPFAARKAPEADSRLEAPHG
jgi:hypothetical protein